MYQEQRIQFKTINTHIFDSTKCYSFDNLHVNVILQLPRKTCLRTINIKQKKLQRRK